MKRIFSTQTIDIHLPAKGRNSNRPVKKPLRKTWRHLYDGSILKFSIAGSPLTLLLTTLPVFIISCVRTEPQPERTETGLTPADATSGITLKLNIAPSKGTAQTLDILFFNNDRNMRLDSWQHIDSPASDIVNAASRNGSKIATVIANAPPSLANHTASYESLSALLTRLEDEDVRYPVMKGERSVETKDENYFEVEMVPFMSQIVIESISCDFHGKAYEGSRLEDVSIYLTNVRTEWPLSGNTEEFYPSELANQGGLDAELPVNLEDKIVAKMEKSIGLEVLFPDIHLWCYPDGVREESPGLPFTRLVIEGTLEGEKTYYPININRNGNTDGTSRSGNTENSSGNGNSEGPAGNSNTNGTSGNSNTSGNGNSEGLAGNGKYIYNITLTQRGTKSPEDIASSDVIQARVRAKAWTEKEGQAIKY